MKKIFTIILLFVSLTVFCQSKEDTLYRTAITFSYQPAIGIDLYGFGLYLHGIAGPVGIYGSMDGLPVSKTGDKKNPFSGDKLESSLNKRMWGVINFGITIKTVPNFYLYCGYSTGGYKDQETDIYYTTTTNQKYYSIVNEKNSTKPGCDFGAIYYAGKGGFRCGLQLGFNTSMQTAIIGIHLGCFIKKTKYNK